MTEFDRLIESLKGTPAEDLAERFRREQPEFSVEYLCQPPPVEFSLRDLYPAGFVICCKRKVMYPRLRVFVPTRDYHRHRLHMETV